MHRTVRGGAELSIIDVKDLCFTYGINTPFEKKAVIDLNLSVNEGEVIGLIGHTGSGKSTFVQMLNGLIRPTSGKVFLNGDDIWEKPKEIRKIRFKVGMVFQYPEYQLFDETVYKDISFGPINKGLSGKEVDETVRKAAKFVGLSDELLNQSPFDLSGGEKRRAAIAGVIAMDPDVLVLDEPTAGLDPMGRNLLLSQIMQYHRERKNTIIIVSHSMEDIARIADRVMVINNGKLEMLDTPEKVFSEAERLEKMGLEVPQITKIMLALKEKGYDVPSGILTVEKAFLEVVNLLKKEGKI
jgi:energy-coupling factor transport system ATP-binding protein